MFAKVTPGPRSARCFLARAVLLLSLVTMGGLSAQDWKEWLKCERECHDVGMAFYNLGLEWGDSEEEAEARGRAAYDRCMERRCDLEQE